MLISPSSIEKLRGNFTNFFEPFRFLQTPPNVQKLLLWCIELSFCFKYSLPLNTAVKLNENEKNDQGYFSNLTENPKKRRKVKENQSSIY